MPSILPVKRAHEIQDEDVAGTKWLIYGLWGEAAVGIIGGEPKCYKSFSGLTVPSPYRPDARAWVVSKSRRGAWCYLPLRTSPES